MVTAEDAKKELKEFCSMFGFNFNKDLKIQEIDKKIVFMHGTYATAGFYRKVMEKYGSFDLRDQKIIKKLREKAEKYLDHLAGGSGYLNWSQKLEAQYDMLRNMTRDQALHILWYPKFIDEKGLKEALPAKWGKYIPQFIPEIKFNAFIKFIYPEWLQLIVKLRTICYNNTKEKIRTGKVRLPWYWYGEITGAEHAAILHESIHCILANRGMDEGVSNAYIEGIDVFFHRKSGLYLGFYKKHFWSPKDIKKYWNASEIFWKEFENETDLKKIPKVLQDRNNEITKRIIRNIKEKFPGLFHG